MLREKTPRCRALIVVMDYTRLFVSQGQYHGHKKERRCLLHTARPSGFCWRHEQERAGEVEE